MQETGKEPEQQKFEIEFMPLDAKIKISADKNLLEAAKLLNIALISDCGGVGICGKCKLKLQKGTIISEKISPLPEDELKEKLILACISYPASDITVEIPEYSIPPGIQIIDSSLERLKRKDMPYSWGPLVEKYYIECPPPTSEDNLNDLGRVCRTLRQKTGVENFTINHRTLQSLQKILRQSDWKITTTLSFESYPAIILAAESNDTSEENYGVVIDVGTTTLECALVEISMGNIRRFTSYLNPQAKYGKDIVSRMNFASREDKGLYILNDLIIDRINEILLELTSKSEVASESIYSVVLSGNTVMLHFLMGLETSFLKKDPGVPAALVFPTFKASELNLYVNPEAIVYISPGMGSYVGGDLTSSLIATGMHGDNFLLMDIGTNGEVAAVVDGAIVCASTSAGPAFEGGGIKCGMPAVAGAINRVHYSEIHKDFIINTIANQIPSGICGAGLIDLTSILLLTNFIDKRGRFRGRRKTSRIRTVNGIDEFVLVFSEEKNKTVSVTGEDIEYLIKSKGALYTGVNFLLKKIGKQESEIDKFFIAGALGGMINIESGINIGLFPDVDRNKFHFIGNGSLLGGWMLLLSKEARKKADQIANSAVYFDLSSEPEFMNAYTSSLFLPHTDLDRFPSVVKQLQ